MSTIFEITDLEEKVVEGNFLEIETAQLLESDHCQACIEPLISLILMLVR